MEYLPLNSVIAEAISITPDTDAADWAVARQWAVTAMMQLGTSEDEIEVCRIDAKNLVLMKPKDMRQCIEMALYDSSDCYIPHVFHAGKKRIYPDNRYFPTATNTSTTNNNTQYLYLYPVDVSEDQQAFYLGTNATQVSYAMVRYYAYPLDENGLPMIRQDEKFAIMCYIRWAKSAKRNENQGEIAGNWMMWAAQHDRARAMKKKITVDKGKTISREWMRLLPSFNYSKF